MLGVCSLVTGAPGAGKTLGWVRWLCTDFLCRPGGRVITNIRLHPDFISDFVARRCNTFYNRRWGYAPSYDDVFSRLEFLDDDKCAALRDCSDVSSFFGDIEDAYICLDEFHTFLPQSANPASLRSWANWLAVLRHHHASICAISQDVSQIAREYKSRVEARIEFLSPDSVVSPFLKIPLGDYANLISAIRGTVFRPICRAIYVKASNGRWRTERMSWDFVDNRFFNCYDSWQKGGAIS